MYTLSCCSHGWLCWRRWCWCWCGGRGAAPCFCCCCTHSAHEPLRRCLGSATPLHSSAHVVRKCMLRRLQDKPSRDEINYFSQSAYGNRHQLVHRRLTDPPYFVVIKMCHLPIDRPTESHAKAFRSPRTARAPAPAFPQVQFRNNMTFRKGPPQTHNGVVRTAHPNDSYLVGFEDGAVR